MRLSKYQKIEKNVNEKKKVNFIENFEKYLLQ